VARLRWHLELGHRVVLASASLEPYLLPLGRLLGVDGVVCTRLEQGPDGRLTGRLDGANCRGPEKERRVVEWLREHDLADATLWAYGDSRGDAELLARADHPVWVRGRTVETMPVNHMEQ
jgi:phosphatidylglycerophosphatase C